MVPARGENGTEPPANPDDELRERLIEAFGRAPQPVVNTTYLADRVDLSNEETRARLERLADAGVVDHMEVRRLGHLWWLSDATLFD